MLSRQGTMRAGVRVELTPVAAQLALAAARMVAVARARPSILRRYAVTCRKARSSDIPARWPRDRSLRPAVIWASCCFAQTSLVWPRSRYGPLRLVLPRRPATFLEGTRDTPEYRIFGRARAVDVNIFVDIRRLHPTRADLRAAQRVVSRIRFS